MAEPLLEENNRERIVIAIEQGEVRIDDNDDADDEAEVTEVADDEGNLHRNDDDRNGNDHPEPNDRPPTEAEVNTIINAAPTDTRTGDHPSIIDLRRSVEFPQEADFQEQWISIGQWRIATRTRHRDEFLQRNTSSSENCVHS